MKNLMLAAESPNQTRMLHSDSILKNNVFDLGSNSGDKDDVSNEILHNLGSSMKSRKRARNLFNDFENTEFLNLSKAYGISKIEATDTLTKVKQNQASKNIIK